MLPEEFASLAKRAGPAGGTARRSGGGCARSCPSRRRWASFRRGTRARGSSLRGSHSAPDLTCHRPSTVALPTQQSRRAFGCATQDHSAIAPIRHPTGSRSPQTSITTGTIIGLRRVRSPTNRPVASRTQRFIASWSRAPSAMACSSALRMTVAASPSRVSASGA